MLTASVATERFASFTSASRSLLQPSIAIGWLTDSSFSTRMAANFSHARDDPRWICSIEITGARSSSRTPGRWMMARAASKHTIYA